MCDCRQTGTYEVEMEPYAFGLGGFSSAYSSLPLNRETH